MRQVAIVLAVFVTGCSCGLALNPDLDISQYAHNTWTSREGFSLGNIYAMAQTPDGYLWFGTEFGLFRFDGVRTIQWEPPAGQHLSEKNINSLLVTRDGALWIGTFAGLVTWSGGKLTPRLEQELAKQFVASLFEDSEGTVWAGTLATPSGRLCAIRSGGAQCYGEDGGFGRAVWALYEEASGTLWAAAESGLWRMKPGPPRRYPTSTELIGLSKTDDGRLLIAKHGAGLLQLAGDKIESLPVRGAIHSNQLVPDRDLDSNRVLRDRDGGLWIGTVERGLIHEHHSRTDVFTRADGLSGDVILSLFEDREGNVWVATTGGLDRFRELPVGTVSVKQGLSSDAAQSVLAAADGSIWVGAHEGLTRWKNGQATIFRKTSGLPDDAPESLFQDDRGRIWVSTRHGLAYFKDGRFVAVNAVRGEVHFITGDKAGNLWLSEHQSLLHLRDGLLVEQIPWSKLGRRQSAEFVLSGGEPGGVWLGFWVEGGVSYFKDGQLRVSYTAADGLGKGGVPDLQLDRDGALWAATQDGGLNRIKDGRIATLTTRNGLPCDRIHWTIEDDDRSFWLYTSCGLVRITRRQLDAWIANPKRRVEATVWDAADGVRLRSTAASAYGPRVTKSADGNLWFVTGEGVQVIDPRRLPVNKIPPPVHIEQVTADGKPYQLKQGMRLPAKIRDLSIDYTALSLVAPEKVHFKYKLEGQDQNWKEVINDRQAQYTNLSPRDYRFRVVASNNSGVWNETGDSLEFSIAPAYYQTYWFRALCVAVSLALLWAAYQVRERKLHREFQQGERLRRLEADLRHLNRVSMMGELAASVVHEVNQPISGVVSNGSACLRWLARDVPNLEEAREAAQRIVRDGKRAGEVIARIRALASKRAATQKEELDLNETIQEVLALVGDEAKKKSIIIRTESADDLPPVAGDRVQLQQVVLNLVMNAIEAMSGVGDRPRELVVTTEKMDADQVLVTVEDSGIGIDPQVIDKIFDSFYTTKPSGMGMGLSISRSILEAHGGRLWAEAKDGPGTVFHFTVPKHHDGGSNGAGAGV